MAARSQTIGRIQKANQPLEARHEVFRQSLARLREQPAFADHPHALAASQSTRGGADVEAGHDGDRPCARIGEDRGPAGCAGDVVFVSSALHFDDEHHRLPVDAARGEDIGAAEVGDLAAIQQAIWVKVGKEPGLAPGVEHHAVSHGVADVGIQVVGQLSLVDRAYQRILADY